MSASPSTCLRNRKHRWRRAAMSHSNSKESPAFRRGESSNGRISFSNESRGGASEQVEIVAQQRKMFTTRNPLLLKEFSVGRGGLRKRNFCGLLAPGARPVPPLGHQCGFTPVGVTPAEVAPTPVKATLFHSAHQSTLRQRDRKAGKRRCPRPQRHGHPHGIQPPFGQVLRPASSREEHQF